MLVVSRQVSQGQEEEEEEVKEEHVTHTVGKTDVTEHARVGARRL